jgi:mono/diheme cytochrome c family protein
MRPAILTLVLTTALFAAGCGAVGHLEEDDGDPARGKVLFAGEGTCGACHVLADAGTQGPTGPNLDDAFRYVKKQGFDISTIRDVVRGQIAYSYEADDPSNPGTGVAGMPQNLLRGQDARDVAAYVAACSASDEFPHAACDGRPPVAGG